MSILKYFSKKTDEYFETCLDVYFCIYIRLKQRKIFFEVGIVSYLSGVFWKFLLKMDVNLFTKVLSPPSIGLLVKINHV